MGTCGIASGAREVVNALAEALMDSGRTDVRADHLGLHRGLCHEPVMTVETLRPSRCSTAASTPGRPRTSSSSHVLDGQIASAHLVYVGKEASDFQRRKEAKR